MRVVCVKIAVGFALLALLGCGRDEQAEAPGDWTTYPWITPLTERVLRPGTAPEPFLKAEKRAAYVPGLRWAVRQVPIAAPP